MSAQLVYMVWVLPRTL